MSTENLIPMPEATGFVRGGQYMLLGFVARPLTPDELARFKAQLLERTSNHLRVITVKTVDTVQPGDPAGDPKRFNIRVHLECIDNPLPLVAVGMLIAAAVAVIGIITGGIVLKDPQLLQIVSKGATEAVVAVATEVGAPVAKGVGWGAGIALVILAGGLVWFRVRRGA